MQNPKEPDSGLDQILQEIDHVLREDVFFFAPPDPFAPPTPVPVQPRLVSAAPPVVPDNGICSPAGGAISVEPPADAD
jgi:hypothetical protein